MKTQSPSLLASFCRLLLANITKLKNKPTRSLVLLGLIAVATSGLASTASSAASLRQLILGLGLSHASGSALQPKAALTNPVLTAPMPQLSSTMTVERRAHSATQLADGRVLIVGGENGGGLISQSEIFDPTAGTFSVGGNLSDPRADHSAIRLVDGRVLITGGRGTAGALNTTEIFDPTTGAFASGPAMGVARAGHSATLLADGRVLIAGGDANGSAEIFDPSTGNFSAVAANMNVARSMHSAALLQDGRVLIVGGRTTAGDALSSGEIFDPSNSTFADAGSTKDTHVRAVLRVLPDGKVQIIGGDVDHNAIELYDPAAAIFGAHAHDIDPANDEHAGLIAELMSSPSRAALIHNGQTITELPGSNKALGAGGTDSSGNATSAATIYDSSPASVTTDVLDYPPGTPVIITGRGFQPNELVDLTFHEDPHTHAENVRTVQADASGNFTYNQYAPEEHDLGVVYILGAKGQSSGLTAQTTFTDAVGLEIRESTCTTIQSTFTLGQTVCARASGLGGNTYHIEWFSPANVLKNTSTDSTTGNLQDTYTPDSVGTWTVKVIRNSDSSVQKTQTFVVTVAKTTPVITFGAAPTPTFGGGNFTVSATTTNTDSSALTYSVVSGPCALVSGSTFSSSGAGTCVVLASGAETTNFNAASNTQSVTIAKATPILSVSNSPVTFNGSPQAATVVGSVSGTVSNIKYNASATVPTNAATYAVTADFAPTDTTNYNGLTGASAGNFVIQKATPTLSVTNSPVTYDGAAHAATVTGSVAGLASNISTGGAASQTSAGTYAVTADFAPTDTVNYNGLTGASAGNFVIQKATPTLSVTNSPVTYDGAAHAATVTGSVAGLASNISTGGAASQTSAGTYAVTADFAPTDTVNYNGLTGASAGNFVIQKATPTLSVTNSPVTYDGAAHAATVTGSVAGLAGNI